MCANNCGYKSQELSKKKNLGYNKRYVSVGVIEFQYFITNNCQIAMNCSNFNKGDEKDLKLII